MNEYVITGITIERTVDIETGSILYPSTTSSGLVEARSEGIARAIYMEYFSQLNPDHVRNFVPFTIIFIKEVKAYFRENKISEKDIE